MKKLKRIIVGVDVVEKSDNVLKRALMLAKDNKADLFIVHAVQIPWLAMPNFYNTGEISIDKNAIEKKIEKKIKAINSEADVPYYIFVKEGNVDDIILHESKLNKADMIVIGAHSKSKGRKSFLGTTAQKVAHKSHLPVLVVKNAAKKPYQNIVAPTDFEMQSKQSILFVKNISPASKVSIVNVFETIYFEGPYAVVGRDLSQFNDVAKSSAKKDLKDFMKEVSINKGKVIEAELDFKETLLEYINKDSYDLVVVGSRGTSGFNALLGSVATYLLREVSNDVLIYVP